MPFSSSFCLTNTGSLQLGTSVDFYSDEDNYTDPFQTDILLSDITAPNCPYVLTNIPDGTTTLQILDVNSSCCVEIPISQNTICDICDLGFDVYSSTTLSRIVAGNLTGSCSANITDYLIEWYNINDLNTVVYTSGKGSEFLPYGFPHPLTGIASIPALSGTYVPIIKYIKLNGINYSSDLETGFVQAELNCFTNTTISVSPLTCVNGNISGDYTHLIQFSGASQGIAPVPVQSTFLLSNNTNYFAWRFNAFNVQDTIKITYYGTHYNNTPIVLEYFNVGNDNTSTIYSNNPKTVQTSNSFKPGFNKVTCLTGLTRSTNDYLVLEIIPNVSNFKTDFELYFTCLENYNCETCYDNYLNSPYKILGNTITGQTLSCNRFDVTYTISGCSTSDLSTSDYYKYSFTASLGNQTTSNTLVSSFNGSFINGGTLQNSNVSCSPRTQDLQTSCQANSDNTLSFIKDNSGVGGIGNVYMTFSSFNDLSDFFNTYNQRLTTVGVESDPTKLGYYSYVMLKVPIPSSINDPCGDGTPKINYLFHTSSVVTTGITQGNYFMNLTMPTITKQISFTSCDIGCDLSVVERINEINLSSTGTTNLLSWKITKEIDLIYHFLDFGVFHRVVRHQQV